MSILGSFELDTIVVGDCLDVMRQMPDGCVDLVVTDPPYGIGKDFGRRFGRPQLILWKELYRVLDGQLCLTVSNRHLPEWFHMLSEAGFLYLHMSVYWNTCRCLGGRKGQFAYAWEPWLHWATKPVQKPVQVHMRSDVFQHLGRRRTEHCTEKDLGAWTRMLSLLFGGLVFDPFIGSGTTAVAAKKLGRHYFGCDINPDYVKLARERLSAIQPRLL